MTNTSNRNGLLIAAALASCVVIAALFLTLPEPAPSPKSSRVTPIVLAYRAVYPCTVALYLPDKKEASGAGVIVDVRGYIVTSAHVVGNLRELEVKLFDGSSTVGTVLEVDLSCDLALLKIKTAVKLLAIVPVNPDPPLEVGETVIAIGSPYGHVQTLTTGVASALNREFKAPTGYTLTGLIQFSASVNPGNSGGPLLNINGEMIGIVCALQSGAGGIGFAIPAVQVAPFCAKHVPGFGK